MDGRRALLGAPGLALALAVSLSGCSTGDDPGSAGGRPTAQQVTMPVPAEGEIVLLDRGTAFVAYDPATGELGRRTDVDDYFAYEFATQTGQVTAGSSYAGGFVALRREGDAWIREASVPAGQALFPLAADGTRTYFVRQAVARPARQTVVRLVEGRLEPVVTTGVLGGDPVVGGAALGDRLYVTSYVEEADAFELRVLRPDAAEPADTVREVGVRLAGEELLADGQRVWGRTGAGFTVVAGVPGPGLSCRGQCSVVPGQDLLLDWREGAGRPRLRLVDTATGEQVTVLRGVLDFRVVGDRIVLHGVRGRSVRSLPELFG